MIREKGRCVITGKWTSGKSSSGEWLSDEGQYIITMGLEDKLSSEKNLVISDLHIPYQDNSAVKCMLAFSKKYKPQRIIVNGDVLDFYSLSVFDKCPERKENLQGELQQARDFFKLLRKNYDGEIIFLEGNHENRLQRYLWRNPELAGLKELKIENLLHLSKYNVKQIKVESDYWSAESGEHRIKDLIIQHGDGRLNGAKYSQNPGYAAFNTLKNKGGYNLIMGHTHRLAQIYNRMGDKSLVGIEGGCLCKTTRANWQQGFVTFENNKTKTFNYKIHRILNGKIQ